jgi:bifunctional non-homologous end joining protein LigD
LGGSNGTCQFEDDPHRGFVNGKIQFSLHGKKLKGKFVLVKMHKQKVGPQNNWLLIKTN